jgi:hypothetical protein
VASSSTNYLRQYNRKQEQGTVHQSMEINKIETEMDKSAYDVLYMYDQQRGEKEEQTKNGRRLMMNQSESEVSHVALIV